MNKEPKPQLEDLLNDPEAKWSDIRLALASHGACTNVALIRKLSNRTSDCLSLSDRDTFKESSNSNMNRSSTKGEESDRQFDDYLVPLAQEPVERKPICRAWRRASRRQSSRRSSRLSTIKSSLASLTMSINLMDFGVENFVDLEDEGSKGDTCGSRQESILSVECDSDGFVGWNVDSDDEASIHSSKIDPQGTETQEPSTSIRIVNLPLADNKGDAARVNLDDEGTQTSRKSWHIEDYEGQNDDIRSSNKDSNILSMLRRTSSKAGKTHSRESNGSFWKKYIALSNTKSPKDVASTAAAAELDNNVKRALRSMRKSDIETETSESTSHPVGSEAKLSLFHRVSSMTVVVSDSDREVQTYPVTVLGSNPDSRKAIWINRSD